MGEDVPHKADIMAIFKRLRGIPTNKVCFDCSSKNPTWSSVTYGVFLCIDCSAVHRGLGVHVTFVRSTQLDTNWTWLQLRNMQLGGNANARKFFHQHNCSSTDAQQKYHSRAAQLYRDKLHGLAVQAMKLHGTQLAPPGLLDMAGHSAGSAISVHIDAEHHDGGGEKPTEVDFFDEHSAAFEQPAQPDNQYSAAAHFAVQEPEPEPSKPASNGSAVPVPGAGPSVEHVLSSSPSQQPPPPAAARKSTIGQRRPAGGKLGARKLGGGLGAQKVKKDFSEIERAMEQADMMKVQAAEAKKEEARQSAADRDQQLASVRLAYQDLSLEQRKQSDRIKTLDPKKAEQMERLGMGFGGGGASGGVSHSAFSDMDTIEQSAPASSEPFGRRGPDAFSSRRDDMDDFEQLGFSSKNKSQPEDDDFFGGFSSGSGLAGLSNSSGGGWGKTGGGSSSWDKTPSSAPAARRPPPADTGKTSCGDDAQKKFGNAKSISSAAYFGDERPSFESQQNMNRFQGARGISSADYFGEPQTTRGGGGGGGGGPMMQTPDLEDVKESVRQGVTKVAGRLGTLANGVMSSLQERDWN